MHAFHPKGTLPPIWPPPTVDVIRRNCPPSHMPRHPPYCLPPKGRTDETAASHVSAAETPAVSRRQNTTSVRPTHHPPPLPPNTDPPPTSCPTNDTRQTGDIRQ